MPVGVRVRLSAMMFLTYVIWGAWLPLLNRYLGLLGFSGSQRGWVFACQAIASLTTMFLTAQIADRWFAAERFMAVSHLIGGIALIVAAGQHTFAGFFPAFLVYMMMFLPTVTLANAVSFAHIPDARRDYGSIRLWATLGWAAAAWPFFFIFSGLQGDALVGGLRWIFYVPAVVSIGLSVFCLTLPHTPPQRQARDLFAPLRAMTLLADRSFLVLLILAYFSAVFMNCHFIWMGSFLPSLGVHERYVMPIMSLGQISEIVALFALGACLKWLGWRRLLAVGILANVVRYGLYVISVGRPSLIGLVVAGNIVHGATYAFFFAAGMIYVEEYAPKDIRASAQALFNLVTLGLGFFTGSLLWNSRLFVDPMTHQVGFVKVFLTPAVGALIACALLLVTFRPGTPPSPEAAADTGMTDQETAEVERRLRDLGYVE